MNPLGAPAVPFDLLSQAAPAKAAPAKAAPNAAPRAAGADAETRARIEKTAKEFEATFISQMLGAMFSEVEVSAPFGGGPGEAAFRSFLFEATAKQMASAGGLGLADDLKREMLRMQGLD